MTRSFRKQKDRMESKAKVRWVFLGYRGHHDKFYEKAQSMAIMEEGRDCLCMFEILLIWSIFYIG